MNYLKKMTLIVSINCFGFRVRNIRLCIKFYVYLFERKQSIESKKSSIYYEKNTMKYLNNDYDHHNVQV